MTALQMWVQSAAAKALGWTLLHSLWEGAVVALALAVVLAAARSSRIRYAAACVAMLGLLAAAGVTFYRLMPRDAGGPTVAPVFPAAVHPTPDDLPGASVRLRWDLSDLPPWLAPLWMAGVFLFQLRCLASWLAAGRLRRTGVCGAPDIWVARLDDLRARLRMVRPVRLLESCLTEVPVVIGHLRPVILMPVGLLAGLPVGQVESILLHELAHIRRADYLVNLMQTLMEGLLFYHPAAWWVSSVIRAERENCCDDVAVATSGDAHQYAKALAALAEDRFAIRDAAMAATGGNLVRRIRRLLAQPEGPRAAAPVLSAGVLVVTCAVALAAWQTPRQNTPGIVPTIPGIPAPAIKPRTMAVAQTQPAPEAHPQDNPRPDPAASPYLKWLNEEVPYIITDDERAAFKKLGTDDERKTFIEQFWARRDPTPGTPENEFKSEHDRRIAYVNNRFSTTAIAGWKTDRGRIYIQYGPPDEIESHPSGGTYTRPAEQGGGQTQTYPFEQWRYRFIDGLGKNIIVEFVDTTRTGEYRMTMDPNEKDALLFVPKAGVTMFRSVGSGSQATVEVDAERKVVVTLPIDYDATELSAQLEPGTGKTIYWINHEALTDPCYAKADPSGCRKNYTRTISLGPVDPGSYVFTASVKNSGVRSEKTFVVNFSVK